MLKPPRKWYPHAPRAFRWLAWAVCRLACILLRVRFENMAAFPKEGPVLVIAPHVTYLDFLFLYGALPRPPHFMADSFFLKHPVSAWATWIGGVIPIDRQKKDPYCLRQYLRQLSKGEIGAFFPEGARSVDGRILPPMTQAVKLVAKANVPVAVFALQGAYNLWPRWDSSPRLFKIPVTVRFVGLYKQAQQAATQGFWKGVYQFKKKISIEEERIKLKQALDAASAGEPYNLDLSFPGREQALSQMLCFCPQCVLPNGLAWNPDSGSLLCRGCRTVFKIEGKLLRLEKNGDSPVKKPLADWFDAMIRGLRDKNPDSIQIVEQIQARVEKPGEEPGPPEPASIRIDQNGFAVRTDSKGIFNVPVSVAARGSSKGAEVLEIVQNGQTLVLSIPGGNAIPWLMLARKFDGWQDFFSET